MAPCRDRGRAPSTDGGRLFDEPEAFRIVSSIAQSPEQRRSLILEIRVETNEDKG
jgi:hypothetical protein